MAQPRLKPEIWVKAQLRLCDRAGIAFTVLRRGDADGGSVMMKIIDGEGRAQVFSQTTAPSGGLAWLRPLGPEPVEESEADAYLARQREFDPDIWLLEIIDRAGSYQIDGDVLESY